MTRSGIVAARALMMAGDWSRLASSTTMISKLENQLAWAASSRRNVPTEPSSLKQGTITERPDISIVQRLPGDFPPLRVGAARRARSFPEQATYTARRVADPRLGHSRG